ncbi:RINT1-like protein MAG2 isoform X2 [Silene latifolia]|uniref:RINT1-like protein MAG2 isoform X2 n=1 Tax=Silene latifolia TaxID=37657 RepID=UPI003D77A3BF
MSSSPPQQSPSPMTLPATSTLSPAVVSYLNSTFSPKLDLNLSESTHRVSQLDSECSQLTHKLADLTRHLEALLLSYASSSDQINGAFHHVRHRFDDLKSASSSFDSNSDGGGEQMVAEELPELAKEVARVEMARDYAETALKLDGLVGEIEDAVSSVMSRSLKKHIAESSKESRSHAISSLNMAEDVLASVMKAHPHWTQLVTAADHRVNRALAILRPQAIADHRTLLSSLGWPPPLSTLGSSNMDTRRTSEVPNPISAMHGELKQNYSENFLALCSLQQLQRRRKARQLQGYNNIVAQYQPLWGIEELVNPLSLASQTHFQKWIDKPEYIFALVYKITRDYIDSVDELLQPLVDKAMLTGYSCREEWISGMVTSLSTYLAKEIFPKYCSSLNEETLPDVRLHTRLSWLHLVDLMISFDKRIRALAAGIIDSEYGLLQRMSSLSVFCDRPDWLDIWAEIELGSLLDKLKPEMEDDRNWTIKTHGTIIPGSDDYKSPIISFILLEQVELVIERCKSLPTVFMRFRFVRLVGAPIVHNFLSCLINKCQEAEGLTALADDDALARVLTSINSARHIGSVLKVRSDDDFFLDMALENNDQFGEPFENSRFAGAIEETENGVFEEDIRNLEEFRIEWIDNITNVVLRGLDAPIRDYVRNKKQWQEKVEEGWTVTQSFVVALDYLQGKISKLEEGLNNEDFITVWKGVAKGIDRLIFTSILISNAKFHDGGVIRFGGDMDVLFGVFKSWCLRPEGFFPRVSEGLKLLKMDEDHLHDLFVQGEGWMKHNKFRHLSLAEAEKIARCRVFKH